MKGAKNYDNSWNAILIWIFSNYEQIEFDVRFSS